MTTAVRTLSLAAAGIVVALASPPALAQIISEPAGTITATIDGEPYAAETLSVPSEGTSTAEAREMGPVTLISIQGHDPQAASIMDNVLNIEFTLMGADIEAMMMSATVSYWPAGMGSPFYHSDENGDAVEVTLESLSLADGAARAVGTFAAELCRIEDFFSPADLEDCVPVTGTFDTALLKAN